MPDSFKQNIKQDSFWSNLSFQEKIEFNRQFNTDEAYKLTRFTSIFIDKTTGNLICFAQPENDKHGIKIMMMSKDTGIQIVMTKEVYEQLCYFLSMYNEVLHRLKTKSLYTDLSEFNVPTADTCESRIIYFNGESQ